MRPNPSVPQNAGRKTHDGPGASVRTLPPVHVTCPACGRDQEADLSVTGEGGRYDFMDGSFVWPEYEPSAAARDARCAGCRVRLLFFDAVELAALEAAGLLHPRVVADRRALAAKARRAPAGALADVPAALLASVPRALARDFQVVPFRDDGDELAVAFSPWQLSKYEERRLAAQIGRHVRGYAVAEGDLVDGLVRYYGYTREEL